MKMSMFEQNKTAGKKSEMALIEVKKTADGRILARRNDGLNLTPEDREEAKALAKGVPPPCWNCGATMTRTKDISGKPWWACWSCARTA